MPRLWALATAAAAVLLWSSCVLAQTSPVAAVAGYQGADRQQRLLEGAKREKELTIYWSIPPGDIAALMAGFDKKYGIKVKAWRSDSESMQQRVVSEARARRSEVDIVAGSASALEPLYRENLLEEVKSPYLADISPQAIPPHRQWVAIYFSLFVQAYNTSLVRKESLPKSYDELVQPQWKGKLGVEADDFDWFAEVVRELGEERGLRLFRDIVLTNGISVRKGHSVLTHLVAVGEVPLALSDYNYLAEQAKQKGAPLDWFTLAPTIARASGAAMTRNAPHPSAAVLFYDYLLSDAQPILVRLHYITVSRNLEPTYKGPFKLIDSATMLDQAPKWQELFQKTVIGPSR